MCDAYDYYNHLRLKHLPRTDLSSIWLTFDIEYDHDLDGAMRLDSPRFPSVVWDAITFVCDRGDPEHIYEVRLADILYSTIIDGAETAAKTYVEVSGAGEIMTAGSIPVKIRIQADDGTCPALILR